MVPSNNSVRYYCCDYEQNSFELVGVTCLPGGALLFSICYSSVFYALRSCPVTTYEQRWGVTAGDGEVGDTIEMFPL